MQLATNDYVREYIYDMNSRIKTQLKSIVSQIDIKRLQLISQIQIKLKIELCRSISKPTFIHNFNLHIALNTF